MSDLNIPNPRKRKHADPLTAAYIAKGCITALVGMSYTAREALHEKFGGEMHLIAHAVSDALMLDILSDSVPCEDWTGVYLYEVVETYGEWLAVELRAGPPDVAKRVARMRELILQCCEG